MKRRLSIVLVAMMVLAMSVAPAFAGEHEEVGNTIVKVNAAVTTMDITVPSDLVMDFNADGTNTLPTNFKIKNNSAISGIHLAKIEMVGKNDWKLLPAAADATELGVNRKEIKFSIGLAGALKQIVPSGADADATGSYEFAVDDITLGAGQEKILEMEVERASFTTAVNNQEAYAMTMTFEFN